ncbi:KpsF/GutQ family sugar-phosphate isomerase [Pyrinomonas methylaliphatogenes]|uniref:KpsF/GutQ family protein n=1 Tax=Pyrinomonas methylaliphatogenes TaxID=454194 RepID=A0A0B6WZ22_9BACT|nr:KpsF/GutQ family sugar-phosphate isomerase [Pyrinomonas methylaliphatogenes]CDM66503.1 KpsF/GutQ family protein [Pyrinomonas methylaliphatogenes]
MDGQHFSQVKRFLLLEAEAVARAAGRLTGEAVERAVALLLACRGKVITTGVGKSGSVAQKIAATMTSTGTPAFYLHPSDALHGGLGIVARDDLVLIVSNSGETDEIIAVLPSLKRREVPIIAIVGDLNSTLARRADVALDASVDQEACPLNLAPTASTTVALAIGDALALTLMQTKGLTVEDFALNHPAGKLGKRLTLRVGDLMHSGERNPTVSPDATLLEVVRAITRGGLGAVNVVDERGVLVGLITDGDLRRTIERSRLSDLEELRCAAIMTRTPIVASPDLLAYDALRLMEDRPSQISVLPVVDKDGVCVGLIRLHDIVRSGL